ncbi:mitochondrial phosphate carrier protein 3, mitochondrial [Selaginella moellendorffii]|nr:mitochondrial phosphate carrier protein 3, mitochondrial [Selaginella moellendorffii]|eukprot:XP_024524417.1 mitochondrial phosphate carrier protein 3, mitochondrial [Selaginella moellendorffii]
MVRKSGNVPIHTMALEDSRSSTLPSFLYKSKGFKAPAPAIPINGQSSSRFLIPSPDETRKIAMYSPEFYAACTVGGALCCGLTHMAMTPLDVVKCNMQIDPAKYKSTASGFGTLYREAGPKGLFKGWVPTLLGYSAQGAFKYGLYEFFKKYYSDLAGAENAYKYKTFIYLAGSFSSEFFADIALCPMEAVKVRVQTKPGFANGLLDGLPKITRAEGVAGLYRGLVPLWGRQIPYTMMKFTCFEATVEALYKNVVPKPKDECSKVEQLGVSFAGGYIAGIFCALVSHPADNLVSFLNNTKDATVGQAVKSMGLVALVTRGLPLRIVMIGTLTGAQWVIYDAFKVFVGLPTTGGVSKAPEELTTPLPLPTA